MFKSPFLGTVFTNLTRGVYFEAGWYENNLPSKVVKILAKFNKMGWQGSRIFLQRFLYGRLQLIVEGRSVLSYDGFFDKNKYGKPHLLAQAASR